VSAAAPLGFLVRGKQQNPISPLVPIAVGAGQSVYVSASSTLTAIGAGSTYVGVQIVYQAQGDTSLTYVGSVGQLTDVSPASSLYTLASLSGVISGLAPGNYLVGLAVSAIGGSPGPGGGALPSIYAQNGTTSALVFQS
jgi:hypothetical protein